jgi:hypothetical protein
MIFGLLCRNFYPIKNGGPFGKVLRRTGRVERRRYRPCGKNAVIWRRKCGHMHLSAKNFEPIEVDVPNPYARKRVVNGGITAKY